MAESSTQRSDKKILYDLIQNEVNWVEGTSNWVGVDKLWSSLPSTWPGNGSVLFNVDRGVGEDFLIQKKKMSELTPEQQKSCQGRWNSFVDTLPKSLHESLKGKDLSTSTVCFKLLGNGGTRRKSISKSLREEMTRKKEHICVFCNTPGEPGEELDIDHKDPRKAFVSELTVDDLQFACPKCNARKRTALVKHYKGKELLSPEKLKWYNDPKSSERPTQIKSPGFPTKPQPGHPGRDSQIPRHPPIPPQRRSDETQPARRES